MSSLPIFNSKNPKICIIRGDQIQGGTTTIAKSLIEGLLKANLHVDQCFIPRSGWIKILSIARQNDIILATHNFREAYVAWIIGTLIRKPVVVWFHGPLTEVVYHAKSGYLKKIYLRWFYQRIAYLVFVSKTSKQSFEKFMSNIPLNPKSMAVIKNAIQPQKPQSSSPPPRASNVIKIAYVGRLSHEKNPLLLVNMLRALPSNFQLTIVGDGPLRNELEIESIDLIKAGRIHYLGHQIETHQIYTEHELTVLASLYEGCPLSVLESLEAGVPCVAVPVPSLKEIFEADAPYLLAKNSTAQALADAVLKTLEQSKISVKKDIEKVLSYYQYDKFINDWVNFLKNTIQPC